MECRVRVAVARVHVMDHARRVVHDREPGVEHTAEHVEVLSTRESASRPEHVVEAAELEHELPSERHHRPVPGVEALDGARAASERCGGSVTADQGVIQHPPRDGADRGIGEPLEDRIDPPVHGDAVVVGEQHERTVGGVEAQVARDREAPDVAAHVHGPRRRRDLAGLRRLRRRVDHDDLDLIGDRAHDGFEGVGEHRRAIARADDDGEVTRRRHAAPRPLRRPGCGRRRRGDSARPPPS